MNAVGVYQWGVVDYATTYQRQKRFTESRQVTTVDQLWCLQHTPVYTLGLSGNEQHLLNPGNIPVQYSDRGGQVTYHGPGQLVMYLLIDLKRRGITVKRYVFSLEQAILNMLADMGVQAQRRRGAPGIYIHDKKLAALGVRIRRGCCYHGISLNIDMDLRPFEGINPCGYPGMAVTQLSELGFPLNVDESATRLLPYILEELGFQRYTLHDAQSGSAAQISIA